MKIDGQPHGAYARLDVFSEFVKIVVMPDGGNEEAALEIDIPSKNFLAAADQLRGAIAEAEGDTIQP